MTQSGHLSVMRLPDFRMQQRPTSCALQMPSGQAMSAQRLLVHSLALGVSNDNSLSRNANAIAAQITRYRFGFLPSCFIAGKFLALDVVGVRTMEMKKIERHCTSSNTRGLYWLLRHTFSHPSTNDYCPMSETRHWRGCLLVDWLSPAKAALRLAGVGG